MFTDAKIIQHDVDPEVYHRRDPAIPRGHRDYVMSRSELMEFYNCPARWLRGVPETRSRSTDFGSLLDCALLQPEKFSARYVVQPPTYPAGLKHAKVKAGEIAFGDPLPWNNNATHCDDWNNEQRKKGLTIAPNDEFEASKIAIGRLMEDAEIAALLKGSRRQVYITAFWQTATRNRSHTPNPGIPFKILLDIECDPNGPFAKTIADLKTTRDAHPAKWGKACCEHDYDVQAALYTDIYTAALMAGLPRHGEATAGDPENIPTVDFRHILVENQPPYEIGRRLISAEMLNVGREIYTTAIVAYQECLETGHWPGYDDNPRNLIRGWSLVNPPIWRLNTIYPENA